MDVREKLVELLGNIYLPMMCGPDTIGEYRIPHKFKKEIASHLIAHGVTVQEWISVTERLPESGKQALCFTKRGGFWVAVWDDVGDHLWSDGEIWCSNGYVTHWMPLPPAPEDAK